MNNCSVEQVNCTALLCMWITLNCDVVMTATCSTFCLEIILRLWIVLMQIWLDNDVILIFSTTREYSRARLLVTITECSFNWYHITFSIMAANTNYMDNAWLRNFLGSRMGGREGKCPYIQWKCNEYTYYFSSPPHIYAHIFCMLPPPLVGWSTEKCVWINKLSSHISLVLNWCVKTAH